jgi:hypothetical protein
MELNQPLGMFSKIIYEFDKLENFINSDPMIEFTFIKRAPLERYTY